MTVDILCRVVDNLGDAGFCFRLARALSELPDAPRVRLVVDDLSALASLCPAVDPALPLQTVGDWLVVRWDEPGAEAIARFQAARPRVVLECYACGRPDWLEAILFDEGDPVPRHVVNLEYLTAEPWARDFHRLPSMTRSPLVKKTVFMPGFVPGTGGLLIDRSFEAHLDAAATTHGRSALRRSVLASLSGETATRESAPGEQYPARAAGTATETVNGIAGEHAEQCMPDAAFWTLVFSYEHDFATVVDDLARFARDRPVIAFVAAGRSAAGFFEAWTGAGKPFPAVPLPLLEQTLWDSLLVACDFAIVRGEESFARASLAGKPFLWQCYPFADGGEAADSAWSGHLPKVYAFLELLKNRLPPADFAAYERLTLRFNGATAAEPFPGDLLSVLASPGLTAAFAAFARDTRKLGNLAANLMTHVRDFG